MALRYIFFSFVLAFTLSSPLIAGKDLVIAFEVPRGMKKKLYSEVIENSIPGPHHYHVTLFHIKNVDEKDYNTLSNRLQPIKKRHYSAQFTPESAIELNHGYLAIVPNETEKNQFGLINSHIYQELEKFNHEYGTSYRSSFNTLPMNYTPHITIAHPDYIQKRRINVDNVLLDVNINLAAYHNQNGGTFEVLHDMRPATSSPKIKKKALKKNMTPAKNKSVGHKKPTARSILYKQTVLNSNKPAAPKKPRVKPTHMKRAAQASKPKVKKEQQRSVVKTTALTNSNSPSVNQKKVWQPVERN
jgi:2'-5' RNA ligase